MINRSSLTGSNKQTSASPAKNTADNDTKILVIEDDQNISELIRYNLEAAGYTVSTALDGEMGLMLVMEEKPDLIVLDLMLPKMDGIEICNRIRRSESLGETPIIMLTARGSEMDRIVGLEIGADDYMTKPFSVRELEARIKSVLRRTKALAPANTSGVLRVDDIEIDFDKHEVRRGEKIYTLTLKEFLLLKMLAENRGKVMTRNLLLDEIWGYDYFGETRTVDVHIRHLRSKIEDEAYGNLIETVRGVGYKIK
jgi:two-component system alkaline phosphatase synthesis response regulator PhoP